MTTPDRVIVPCPYCDADVGEAPLAARACSHCGRELVVCQHYRIVELLGRGGMGAVYGAKDESGRKVAAKVLTLKSNDWTAWELFERSSHILMGLEHTGLPRVYAFARDQPARLILVREAFDGGTLADRVKDDRRISPAALRELAVSLLELLVYLQSMSPPIIHRDIKPANLMFRARDSWDPVLVDFDTVAAPEGQRSGLTIVGTVGYTSPEQLTGEATPATDLFSLGATLLNVLTHVEPEKMERRGGRVVLGKFERGLDPLLRAALLRMVEPDKRERFVDARAALDALTRREAPSQAEDRLAIDAGGAGWPRRILHVSALLILSFGFWFGLFPLLHPDHPAQPPSPPETVLPPLAEHLIPDSPTRQPGTAGSQSPASMRAEYKACQAGDGVSCRSLGDRFERGRGDDMDLGQAAHFDELACRLGESQGCTALGGLYRTGRGLERDDKKAHASYEKGCALGDGTGCLRACDDARHGIGTAVDLAAAFDRCKLACDGKRLVGCAELAAMYRDGTGTPRDDFRAAALLSQSCLTSSAACMDFADLVDAGRGVKRDPSRAFWLRYGACKNKDARGCDALTAAFHANRKKTIDRLSLACTDADAFACETINRLTAPTPP